MIICGTGHRPPKLGGYGDDVLKKLFNLAKDWLSKNTVDKVISGVALGWDTALALASIKLGIPLVSAVAFQGQESKWPKESQERFHKILKSSEVVIVSEGGYAPQKMQIRNEWMVNNSDKVLALFNGSKGGTYNCINYAKEKGVEVINLWNLWV